MSLGYGDSEILARIEALCKSGFGELGLVVHEHQVVELRETVKHRKGKEPVTTPVGWQHPKKTCEEVVK